MGDPAGIGLEIAVKAQADETAPQFVLIGDATAAARAGADVRAIESLEAFDRADPRLAVLHRALPVPETPGTPDPRNASTIIGAIETGVALCLEGKAGALVTLPIAKAPLYAAGFGFPGHTEFIADLTKEHAASGARGPVMMLACEGLRVSLTTIHTPLRDVAAALTQARVTHVACVVAQALRQDFGIAAPRLALAALNPHAGENGTIGREEVEVLNPAAASLRAQGIAITDAQPSDTLFHPAARERYDAAICLYHDQALIALKTIDFWGGVNVTLGLPIVRTSPDHGTGFDIAGRGVANPRSFINALHMAEAIANTRATS
jgi:4-hydroxythreonine-4-phosphate dehydrogenase